MLLFVWGAAIQKIPVTTLPFHIAAKNLNGSYYVLPSVTSNILPKLQLNWQDSTAKRRSEKACQETENQVEIPFSGLKLQSFFSGA
jgi:hypothetical protein